MMVEYSSYTVEPCFDAPPSNLPPVIKHRHKQIVAISPDTLHPYRLLLYRCSIITNADLFFNQN